MTDLSVSNIKSKLKKPLQIAQEEIAEIKKTADAQITGSDQSSAQTAQMSPIVEAMQQKSSINSDNVVNKSELRKFKTTREQQDFEIAQARSHREQLEKIASESRDPEEQEVASAPGQPLETVPMPKSRHSRRDSYSPETRKSRH
jgi:hypothetical protein